MNRINAIMNHPLFVEKLISIEQSEQDRIYCRHGLQHLLDVARIAWILCLENALTLPKDIVYAAALLHDIERISEDHHLASVKTAEMILQDCAYHTNEIALITTAIFNHRKSPQNNLSLSSILYSADKTSRLCFLCTAEKSCYWSPEKKNRTLYR